MRRTMLLPLAVPLLLAGCRDGPTGVEPVGIDRTDSHDNTSMLAEAPATPLSLVSEVMGDAFVRPLTVQAVGVAAADKLAVALKPVGADPRELMREAPDEPDYWQAVRALGDISQQLWSERQHWEDEVLRSDAAEGTESVADAELLIVQDALALVVDDALEQLLTASDSSTGG